MLLINTQYTRNKIKKPGLKALK